MIMKITLQIYENKYNGHSAHEVLIDEKHKWSIHSLSECPEDAIIGRDLIDGNDLIAAIKLGYEAAKRGDTLDITKTYSLEDEEDDL